MMDFTTFINSRDIAEHLRSINYPFTAPEAAFVVYENQTATLEEKFAAWEHIIKTLPDCSMGRRINMMPMDSFHDFLRRYINLQKRYIDQFRQPDDHVFLASFLHKSYDGDYSWQDDTTVCFSDMDNCISYMMQEEADYEEQELKRLRILKLPTNKTDHHSPTADNVEINRKGNILSLDVYNTPEEEFEIDSAFEGMWFAFPTPFQRGDILVEKGMYKDKFFVLDRLLTWDSRTCRKQGFCKKEAFRIDKQLSILKERGDTTDMNAIGYYMTDAGIFNGDSIFDYLSFERVREPLRGEERLLKPLSCLMKNEIDPEEFLNAYRLIAAGEYLARIRKDCWYTDEFFKMVGSKREK